MTPEKRDELKKTAEFVKAHVQRTRMCSLDEVDCLARGVLALLAENEAQAAEIQRLCEAMDAAGHCLGSGMHIAAEVLLTRAIAGESVTPANPESKTSAPPRAG